MRIVISGTVGVGKSTTTRLLIDDLRDKDLFVNHLDEKTANSIYLPYYYNNPESWAFVSQVDFLMERFKQWMIDEVVREEVQEEVISIYDRHIIDDFIFSNLESVKESISFNQTSTYHSLYKELSKKIDQKNSKPDYLILLTADIETIVKRLHCRGREAELETNVSYWQELYDKYYNDIVYQKHFKNNAKNVLVIDTENLTPEEVKNKILKEIGLN